MQTLQEMLESSIAKVLAETDSQEASRILEASMDDLIPELADETAETILRTIKRDAPAGLKANRKQRRQFEKRIECHWRKSFDLLDLFISIAMEAGDEFHKTCLNDPERPNETVHEALVRLHARACQIASAILALLRSGYADDAHARWRALHEIAVTSIFISEQGEETAERYLLHEGIQRYKLALKYSQHAEALKHEPLSGEDLKEHRAIRDDLVDRFGKAFKERYGWASVALDREKPTFQNIEESVSLSHWRPYYGMASNNVHANAHGAYYRLGTSPQGESVLLAGPSVHGFADPGISAAISLGQVTIALMSTHTRLDNLVISKLLLTLQEEVGEAFLQVHRGLERPNAENDSEPN